MKVLYTFVIDGNSKYVRQARIFLESALAAGISRDCIVAHLTPSANEAARKLVSEYGIHYEDIDFGPDKRFCNKINQMFSRRVRHKDYDVLAVCDTDLAFCYNLNDYALYDKIRARRVDGPNPPIEILNKLSDNLGIKRCSDAIRTTTVNELTYRYNCNGGLLLIPVQYVDRVGEAWIRYANALIDHSETFGRWINNVDQVSWAFVLMELQIPFSELGIEVNFPSIIASAIPEGYPEIVVIHHHDDLDQDGGINMTNIPIVDSAIRKINSIL